MGEIRKTLGNFLHRIASLICAEDPESYRLDTVRDYMDAAFELRMQKNAEETERRKELGLLDVEAPERWQNSWYLRQGYRVRLAENDDNNEQGNWSGGPCQHAGAVCTICQRPSLMFLNINANDSRFRQESPDVFGKLTRIPLLYCVHHPEPTIYQIVDDSHVRMIKPEPAVDEETPFQAVRPDVFPRRSICLDVIPRTVELAHIIARLPGFEWLNRDELEIISKFLGRKVENPWEMKYSQFGGVPRFDQSNEPTDCPNPDCRTLRMGRPFFGDRRQYQMKDLAIVRYGLGLATDADCANVVFRICWDCHTIQANYECD